MSRSTGAGPEDVEEATETLTERTNEVALDTGRFSPGQSVEILEAVAEHCIGWAAQIRAEMDQ